MFFRGHLCFVSHLCSQLSERLWVIFVNFISRTQQITMGADHHDHHKPPYTVPDYKIYKIEGHPELEAAQKYLAMKGLKDPWLRNEVWRHAGPQKSSVALWAEQLLKGFKYGFAACVVVIAAETFLLSKKPEDPHGHDHH